MDPIAPLIANLTSEGRVRVWSLVITLFGDAVQHRGGRIAAAELLRLFQRIGIEEGTVRTALSRLKSDGWVERDREGRNSFYRLSAKGQALTEEASPTIYRAPLEDPQVWSLQVGAEPEKGFALAEGVWLVPGPPEGGIAVSGALSGQEKVARTAISASHRQMLATLEEDLEAAAAGDLDPLSALAARTLLIHRWRRIALRFPDIPPTLMLEDLPDPRAALARLYPRLFEASEPCLDLPKTQGAKLVRFGVKL